MRKLRKIAVVQRVPVLSKHLVKSTKVLFHINCFVIVVVFQTVSVPVVPQTALIRLSKTLRQWMQPQSSPSITLKGTEWAPCLIQAELINLPDHLFVSFCFLSASCLPPLAVLIQFSLEQSQGYSTLWSELLPNPGNAFPRGGCTIHQAITEENPSAGTLCPPQPG